MAAAESDSTNIKSDNTHVSATKAPSEEEILSSDSESSDFDREYTCDVCEKSFSGMKPLKQHERSGKHLKALRKLKLEKDTEEDVQNDDSSDEDFTLDKNKIYAECEVCCKEFNGVESYRLHMRSKRHKKKMANSKILEKSKEDGKVNLDKLKQIIKVDTSALEAGVKSNSSESDDDSGSGIFECEICEKVFSGLEPYRDHMTSKTHRKTLKQKNLILKLTSLDPENIIEVVDDILTCKLCHVAFSGAESAKAHLKSKRHLDWLEFRKWKKERKNSEKQESESISVASSSAEPTEKNPLSCDEKQLEITDVDEKGKMSESSDGKENESQTIQARISYKKYKEVMNESEEIK